MSRSKQVLINYHTDNATNMPSTGEVRFGEIVVRHNAEVPQLLIKVSSGTSGQDGYGEWFVPFIASGEISTAIAAAVTQEAGVINDSIAQLQNKLTAVSATVTSDYALSANTHAEIEAAKIEAEIASSAYTDSQIEMLSGITSAYVASQMTTASQDIDALKSFTANTAATHDEVATQSAATFESAYTAAVASAQSYTDTKVSDAVTALKGTASESGDTLGELEAAIGALNQKVGTDTNSLASRISELEGSASTWNDTAEKALRSAELAAVEEGATHVTGGRGSGATFDSNAKMAYTEGGNITLDLSGLIIDCGDF